MMRIIFVIFLVWGLSFSTVLRGDEYRKKVKPLKWMGEKKPDTHSEYLRAFPAKPLVIERIATRNFMTRSFKRVAETIVVMVNSSIFNSVQSDVNIYVNTISSQGYNVVLLNGGGGNPVDIRNLLKGYSNLKGCVLIGQFPSAWYEVANDYNAYGYAEFPCDLFYMDLDGNWIDSDGDGKYDNHTDGSGDRQPEIFVARIDASGLVGDEISLLHDYFERNQAFWAGNVSYTSNCIAYTEDDWANFPDVADHLTYLNYTNTTKVKAPSTNRYDYLTNYLNNQQYYVTQLACHSSSSGHYFTRGGVLYTSEVISAPPQSVAYNLFCCSGLRYTSSNCLGKGYVFSTGRGLVAVGSTKTGSMLQFRYFYTPLSSNKRIGEALHSWFNSIGTYDMSAVYWHYGMTILGDPMIYLKEQPGSGN